MTGELRQAVTFQYVEALAACGWTVIRTDELERLRAELAVIRSEYADFRRQAIKAIVDRQDEIEADELARNAG